MGAGSRSTPGIVPAGCSLARACLCARCSGVLPPPRRPGPRHLPCGGPDALARLARDAGRWAGPRPPGRASGRRGPKRTGGRAELRRRRGGLLCSCRSAEAPPRLGWEGGRGGRGEARRPRGYRRSRRSAAGASRLHSGVPAERRGARSARGGLSAERPGGRGSSGFRLRQGSCAAPGSERTTDWVLTTPRSGRLTLWL